MFVSLSRQTIPSQPLGPGLCAGASIKSPPQLVTTSYVFDEVITFFNSRGRHEKAVEVGDNLIQANSIELIHVDEAVFYEGWEYFQKHKDKTYSLTDCISFVVMKQRVIKAALTFDRHFAQAGFDKLPGTSV